MATEDEVLLSRFLGGELDAEAIEALEARMDREPALAMRLGAMARERSASEERTGSAAAGRRRDPLGAPLALGPLIGEGGMGVVHLGRQHSVDREVAIKTVRSAEARSDLLLEEAYVTAALEHPNIVPVHDIVFADDGRPQIVLKRIEGQVWRDLIHAPAGRGAPSLDLHLRIFLDVCGALRFAHDRGFIHRDVKPANVMVGRYDDVYLLDWGLALSLDASAPSPSVQRAGGLAGTPAYMAPEQLDPEATLSPATDVYQLGGTLYEIVTGKPPHASKALVRDGVEGRRQPPALPADCPRELAAIIRRALAEEPRDRFEGVGALAEAVRGFLQHRGSEALAEAGEARAEAMRRAHERGDEREADRAFVESAFSHRMALDAWSDNERAMAGLAEVLEARVRHLLATGDARAAHQALAVTTSPPPALVTAVEEAVGREVAAQARLTRLARDDDRKVGVGLRRVLVIALGTLWVGGWAFLGDPPPEGRSLVAGTLVFLAVATVLVLRRRQVMLGHRTNRQIALLVVVVLVGQILVLLALPSRYGMGAALTVLLLLWATALGAAAVAVDRRILPAACAHAAAFVAAALEPRWLGWLLPGAALACVVNMLFVNRAIAREAEAGERGDATV